MELLYDLVIQFLGINPGDVSIFVILAKTLYMECLWRHYLQWPEGENNPDFHQPMNGKTKYGISTQWNII